MPEFAPSSIGFRVICQYYPPERVAQGLAQEQTLLANTLGILQAGIEEGVFDEAVSSVSVDASAGNPPLAALVLRGIALEDTMLKRRQLAIEEEWQHRLRN